MRIAESDAEQNRILKIRSNIYTALKDRMYDIIDVTVSPSRLGELVRKIDMISDRYKVEIPMYGHAGDGNLHIHIIKDNSVKNVKERNSKIKKEIYRLGISMEGVITGEHGIGSIRRNEMSLQLSKKEIELMKSIKRVFDPKNIMNPKKVLL